MRVRSTGWTTLLLAATLGAATPPLQGQTTIEARGARITVGGRLHTQLATSSVEGTSTDIFMRRARVYVGLVVNDFLEGRVQTDFAGGEASLKDAYMRLDFDRAFRVDVGQFKRAFDLFELASSTRLSIIERDGRVAGVDACAGTGGVCSWSRLTEKLAYADRDVGLRVSGSSGRVAYQFTATNGTGANRSDENGDKSYAGRLTIGVGGDVTLGANLGLHDYVAEDGGTDYAAAFGADLEVGGWQDGFHLQAGVVAGDNWKALDARGDPANFVAFQGVASYYAPIEGSARFIGWEPLLRVSYGDGDTDVADDGGWIITPGVMFYIAGRSKVGVNLDVWSPEAGDSEASLKFQTFLYF